VAERLAASQEGLSSMELVVITIAILLLLLLLLLLLMMMVMMMTVLSRVLMTIGGGWISK
jgi:hypothetical protein